MKLWSKNEDSLYLPKFYRSKMFKVKLRIFLKKSVKNLWIILLYFIDCESDWVTIYYLFFMKKKEDYDYINSRFI